MRRIVLFIMTLVAISSHTFAEGYSYFKYYGNGIIDYNTGRYLNLVCALYNFEACDKIKHTVTSVEDKDGHSRFENFYVDGILVKQMRHVHDRYSEDLKYTSCGFLESYGQDRKFTYLSESVREEYYHGKFNYRETISDCGDYKIVMVERFKSGTEILMLDHTIEYSYNDKMLMSYMEKTYFPKRILVHRIDFSYENGLLVKAVEKYGDNVRLITNIKYDRNGQMYMVSDENVARPEESTVTYFSEYDSHGNWHKSKRYRGKALIEEVSRRIEYSD